MSNPTGRGGFVAGQSGNQGGLTETQREARDWIRGWLAEPEQRTAGAAAYRRLLDADNPLIVKDFMDRIAGKVKESVALEDGGGFLELVRAVLQLPREDRAKLARGEEDP